MMGFLEDKQKIAAYDAAKNSADARNAQMAKEVEAMNAAKLAQEQREREAYLVNQGLAMATQGMNPYGFANVPDKSIAGYQMPAAEPASVTGQDPRFNQMTLREALAKQSNGGLANTMNQNSYQGMR